MSDQTLILTGMFAVGIFYILLAFFVPELPEKSKEPVYPDGDNFDPTKPGI